MQANEAFRIGFLARCAEEGLSPETTAARAKQAAALLRPSAEKQAGNLITDTISRLRTAATAAAILAPPAIGGTIGLLQSRATDVDDVDVQDIKQKELATMYRRMAEELRRKQKLRQRQMQNQSSRQIYL